MMIRGLVRSITVADAHLIAASNFSFSFGIPSMIACKEGGTCPDAAVNPSSRDSTSAATHLMTKSTRDMEATERKA